MHPGQATHPVAVGHQALRHPRPDEPSSPGHKHMHAPTLTKGRGGVNDGKGTLWAGILAV